MFKNRKRALSADLENGILDKINNSIYGIKYPNDILACLEFMKVYDPSKVCPHFCPVGRIIQITKTSADISSIWIGANSHTCTIPSAGETLYVLKSNPTVVKNEFTLIGFVGKKCFQQNDCVLSVDDFSALRISHYLEIGWKVYFKHWERCSVPLIEIPREGIQIPIGTLLNSKEEISTVISPSVMEREKREIEKDLCKFPGFCNFDINTLLQDQMLAENPHLNGEIQVDSQKGESIFYVESRTGENVARVEEVWQKSEKSFDNLKFQSEEVHYHENSSESLSSVDENSENISRSREFGDTVKFVENQIGFLNQFKIFNDHLKNPKLNENPYENLQFHDDFHSFVIPNIKDSKDCDEMSSNENSNVENRTFVKLQMDSPKTNLELKSSTGHHCDNHCHEMISNTSSNIEMGMYFNLKEIPNENSNRNRPEGGGVTFLTEILAISLQYFDLLTVIFVCFLIFLFAYILSVYK